MTVQSGIKLAPAGTRRPSFGGERQVTALAIALAGVFVALALASLVVPGNGRLGTWLPLHLLFAGGASTAIAGVMPFFSAAVSGAPPASRWVRIVAVLGVAVGAAIVVIGRIGSPGFGDSQSLLAGIGGLVYIGGVGAVAAATLLPLRAALGPRRIIMGGIYGMALFNVVLGATLATLLLLGSEDVLRSWPALRAAHAWLNLFGFVSLVIAGSLLHLLPTVVGARINRTRASILCFAGVAAGPVIAALGFVIGSRELVLLGAAILLIGALALGVHAVTVLRARATWTTDPAWHRFATWSLVAGIAWFIVGAAIATWSVISAPSVAAGWQLGPLIAPLAAGWVAQILIGAWSHLVPAVGPGSPQRHAAQRRILGRGATFRLVVLNGGVAAMLAATATGVDPLMTGGVAAVAASGIAAVALLAMALVTRDATGTLPR